MYHFSNKVSICIVFVNDPPNLPHKSTVDNKLSGVDNVHRYVIALRQSSVIPVVGQML